MEQLYGGVELGGTKTVCAIADAGGKLSAQRIFPTTSVDETLNAICEFFEQSPAIVSLGVGSFGPVQLDYSSAEYGYIYNSPKSGWEKVNLKGLLKERLKLPVVIETDVDCAAYGELNYGVAKNNHSFIYITLGTGIGGSLMVNGELVHGILNLEMGHMRIPHEDFVNEFRGACPFHGDCLEGIASGHAMSQRYGKKAEEITDSMVWDIEADYIASALNNLMLTIGPELIILGGGLINHSGLIESVRSKVQRKINNYLEFPNLENYIVKSSGELNSALGAIKLAAFMDFSRN